MNPSWKESISRIKHPQPWFDSAPSHQELQNDCIGWLYDPTQGKSTGNSVGLTTREFRFTYSRAYVSMPSFAQVGGSKSNTRTYLMPQFKSAIAIVLLLAGFLSNAFSADLVYINSSAGSERLLKSDFNRQYFALASYVDTQERLTFCGISSISAALNSLPTMARPITPALAPHPYFTEDSIFTELTTKIKSRDDVLTSGLTLEQIGLYLNSLGANSSIHYGSELSVSDLRALVKSSLSNRYQRILVNFDRKVLNQDGSGHFSPIGAYDSESDSVLILDVAKYKYPPFWVTTSDLQASLNTIDSDSGKSRGVVQITVNPSK